MLKFLLLVKPNIILTMFHFERRFTKIIHPFSIPVCPMQRLGGPNTILETLATRQGTIQDEAPTHHKAHMLFMCTYVQF